MKLWSRGETEEKMPPIWIMRKNRSHSLPGIPSYVNTTIKVFHGLRNGGSNDRSGRGIAIYAGGEVCNTCVMPLDKYHLVLRGGSLIFPHFNNSTKKSLIILSKLGQKPCRESPPFICTIHVGGTVPSFSPLCLKIHIPSNVLSLNS